MGVSRRLSHGWLAELNIKEMEITKEIKKKGEHKTKK
jgi:hypothetical protein